MLQSKLIFLGESDMDGTGSTAKRRKRQYIYDENSGKDSFSIVFSILNLNFHQYYDNSCKSHAIN